MSFIEIKSGAPEVPQDWADGTYLLLLSDISDPKTVLAQKGQMAGQEVDLIDWTFRINQGQYAGLEVRRSTSTASGPKSAMYGILTALLGGKPPAVGRKFDKADLIGSQVLGALVKEESGYLRINSMTAIPAGMLQQQFAQVTGAPTAAPQPARAGLNLQPSAPVAELVGAPADDLPF